MKKIPTLFKKQFENDKFVGVINEVTEGMEWALNGKGIATVKLDGSCCAIIDGEFYKRYDAKNGKKAPEGAIPCCEPDPVTGHHPHWVKVDFNNPADKWFVSAFNNTQFEMFEAYGNNAVLPNGTYEAVGKHFQGNPYCWTDDKLMPHGHIVIKDCPRDFNGLKDFLEKTFIEGIVFWNNGEPQCKIRKKDFCLKWK